MSESSASPDKCGVKAAELIAKMNDCVLNTDASGRPDGALVDTWTALVGALSTPLLGDGGALVEEAASPQQFVPARTTVSHVAEKPRDTWGTFVPAGTVPSTTRQITIPVERFDELEHREQELFRLEKADYRTKWLEAVDTITTLGKLEEQLKARLPACGCIETYPQLIPGKVSHGPGCASAASAIACRADPEVVELAREVLKRSTRRPVFEGHKLATEVLRLHRADGGNERKS